MSEVGSVATANPADRWASDFSAFVEAIDGGGPPWLRRVREEGIAAFGKLGFPGRKDERWKHTDVSPIARTAFRVEPAREPPRFPGDLIEAFTFGVLKCSQLVFVNGVFAPKLSYLRWLPEGVRVRSVGEILRSSPEVMEDHLGRYADAATNPFTALNIAFMQDGAFISIPDRCVVEEPIHLLFVSAGGDAPVASHSRNIIAMGGRSQATIIESYAGLDGGTYLTNAVTEISVGPEAILDHYKMEREGEDAYHVANMALHQGRNAKVAFNSIALGGGLVRNDVSALFVEEGGELDLNGLYALGGRQHVDNHTFIDHATPNCTSRELYKGILDGRSRGIFYGMIRVRKGAMKTNARQTNKNLLLSKEAFVDSTPGLEILADDVRCTHGSTIGQLDENAVFYLQSRGIGEDAARSLLTYAFASEIIKQVRVASMRIKLDQLVLARMPGREVIQEATE